MFWQANSSQTNYGTIEQTKFFDNKNLRIQHNAVEQPNLFDNKNLRNQELIHQSTYKNLNLNVNENDSIIKNMNNFIETNHQNYYTKPPYSDINFSRFQSTSKISCN